MKYIVILGDGMADLPVAELGGKTPLEVANKPNIDSLAQKGLCGMAVTVPNELKPGSDVANLSVMGYSPLKYYSGRSPLEALSIGVDMAEDDLAIRCNLVTLSDEENYADKTMVDYSAGEISTAEAAELIKAVQDALGNEVYHFYSGVSYRHCLIRHHSQIGTDFTPPHDISGRVVGEYLPKGLYGEDVLELMKASWNVLKDHPINQERIKNGKNPANSIWLWGEGSRPNLPNFEELRGLKGAVISAVDLLKGIGIAGGMDVIEVEGATGTVVTNFDGKAKACVDAIKGGYDYVYLHMEAPDECGHQGDVNGKVKSIELIDEKVVGYILKELADEDLKILISPDHPTPIITKTHARDPIPFVIYDSTNIIDGISTYTEKTCQETGLLLNSGDELVNLFLGKGEDMQEDTIDIDNLNSSNAIILDEAVEEQTSDDEAPSTNYPMLSDTQEKEETEENQEENQENIAKIDTNEVVCEEEPSNKKQKDDKKKNFSKKKIAIIAISAVVALMLIIASILTPILIINAPKVFIGKAEDFSKEVGKNKEYYVLNKDIDYEGDLTLGLNVDLNDKILKVNGTLTFANTKHNSLKLGNLNKDVFELGGKIIAKKLVIKSVKEVLLASNVVADEILFESVNQGKTIGGVQANKAMKINACNMNFSNLAFGDAIKAIEVNNSSVTFEKQAKCALSLKNSKVLAKSDLGSTVLDETSELRVLGNVYSNFDDKILGDIKGGKLVYISENSSFNLIENAKVVWLDKYNNGNGDCINCEVKYIKWLATPKKATIEKVGTDIFLVLSNVDADAKNIVLTIDDSKTPVLLEKREDNRYNLTKHLDKVGEHNIKLIVRSAEPEFVRDSEPYFIKYNHTITLEKVQNARVEKNNANEYVLSFMPVDYADSYEITFDGVKYTLPTGSKEEEMTDNLSVRAEVKNLLTPGNHLITIVAKNSKDANIKPSEEVIAEFPAIIGELKVPVLKAVTDKEKTQVTFSWDSVENAVRYELVLLTGEGEMLVQTIVVNTAKTTATIALGDKFNVGDRFILRAIAKDNYQNADSVEVVIG